MTNPSILVVEDDSAMLGALTRSLASSGYGVTAVEDPEEGLRRFDPLEHHAVISDLRMPGLGGIDLLKRIKATSPSTPVVLISAYGSIGNAVEAMRAGATDFLPKPFSREQLDEVLKRVLLGQSVSAEGDSVPADCPLETRDPRMIQVIRLAQQVAATDATVLIHAESGTGKELLARWIHQTSARASKPFVAVNCAALPEGILESELFGHERGSFTGADARYVGRFEQADGGTLVLDEIGEMSLGLQAKLLRVLQEREVDRVGGRGPVSVDIRVIAITNLNLTARVREGKFREDLYYRLRVIPLELPPLRARGGDVLLIAHKMLERFAKRLDKRVSLFSSRAAELLTSYSWPGNVRELENVVLRACILTAGAEVDEEHIFLENLKSQVTDCAATFPTGLTVHEMERRLILSTLEEFQGNRTRAARSLGISIRTLRNKIREYRDREEKIARLG